MMCIQPEGRGCVRGGLVLCRMSLAGFLISHVAAFALVAVYRYVSDGYVRFTVLQWRCRVARSTALMVKFWGLRHGCRGAETNIAAVIDKPMPGEARTLTHPKHTSSQTYAQSTELVIRFCAASMTNPNTYVRGASVARWRLNPRLRSRSSNTSQPEPRGAIRWHSSDSTWLCRLQHTAGVGHLAP